jgi:ABC-2 type transport system permease protein
MRAYVSVLKLRLLNGMQYRAAALAGVATQFFWGFIGIMVFEAFYSHSSSTPPMSLRELVAYIWLQQGFLTLVVLWFRDNEIFDLIVKGNIAYELCRPIDLFGFWYAKLLAQRLSAASLRSLPILIISFFLPEPYAMIWPPNLITFLVFVSALILGMLIVVAISMFIYISVFVTLSPTGSLLMLGVIGEFFAGLIIPVPLMPSWLQTIAYSLPFRWTMDFPFRVYSGQIPLNQAFLGLGIQCLWLAGLLVLGKMALNKALKNVIVQGG